MSPGDGDLVVDAGMLLGIFASAVTCEGVIAIFEFIFSANDTLVILCGFVCNPAVFCDVTGVVTVFVVLG